MGDFAVDIVRQSAPTSTGTQAYTFALGGRTPKACYVICNWGTTEATARADAAMSRGAATSTSQRYCISYASDDGVVLTETYRGGTQTAVLRLIDPSAGTANVVADLSSFSANTVTLNFTTVVGSSPPLVTVIAFAGDDLKMYAGVASLSTQDTPVDVTAPGFAASFGLFDTHGGQIEGSIVSGHRVSYGAATSNGTQRCIGNVNVDAVATTEMAGRFSTLYAAARINSSGSIVVGCEISGWDSQGFTATARIASGATLEVGYLVGSILSGERVKLSTMDTPTATGNLAHTEPGFKPGLVIVGTSGLQTIDSGASGATAGPSGTGCFVEGGTEYANSTCGQDAVVTSNEQSLSQSDAIVQPTETGANGVTADLVSMDGTGFTLNYTTVLASVKKYWQLAIERPDSFPASSGMHPM